MKQIKLIFLSACFGLSTQAQSLQKKIKTQTVQTTLQINSQDEWRYCNKCHAMFYNGYQEKGKCPLGSQHEAAGYNFTLPHDVAGTAKTQASWRYCSKCYIMFYDGYAKKGACAGSGEHSAAGYNFVLPHDIAGTANTQTSWRYCSKCYTMFYDGYAQKGSCAAGGGHSAAGYNFVLPYSNKIKNAPNKIEQANGINYKIYRFQNLNKVNVKGVVLLSSYDASLSMPLLNDIAQQLSNSNYIVAIIQHTANYQSPNFIQQFQLVEDCYVKVMNQIFTNYGGNISKTVIGGLSFTGFALSYDIGQPNSALKAVAGIALIASGTNAYIKVPVVNRVCNADDDSNSNGNLAGNALQNALNASNPTIASRSSCVTDNICTGHHHNDSWATFFVTKIKTWLP
jgi:hypothetical protein